MGLGIGFSSCRARDFETVRERMIERPVYIERKVPVWLQSIHPANPNPKNFIPLLIEEVDGFTVAIIRYPNCTNYEGLKIMVYDGEIKGYIMNAKILDPHFCDHKECISPVARFEPTKRGWEMAINFCKNWK